MADPSPLHFGISHARTGSDCLLLRAVELCSGADMLAAAGAAAAAASGCYTAPPGMLEVVGCAMTVFTPHCTHQSPTTGRYLQLGIAAGAHKKQGSRRREILVYN